MADYIDRQAAIAALREFAEGCKGSTEAATAAAMAISVISRVPGPWVDANTRPPEKTGESLCAFKYRQEPWADVFMDKMTYCASLSDSGFEAWRGQVVSHWMPLPDLPDASEVAG